MRPGQSKGRRRRNNVAAVIFNLAVLKVFVILHSHRHAKVKTPTLNLFEPV